MGDTADFHTTNYDNLVAQLENEPRADIVGYLRIELGQRLSLQLRKIWTGEKLQGLD